MYICIYILTYMQLYIRPDNEIRLRKEENMSGLVNQLLDQHYGFEEREEEESGDGPKVVIKDGLRMIDLGPDEPEETFTPIRQQIEDLGFKYDPTTPGKMFNPENEQYVPYTTNKNGKVVI